MYNVCVSSQILEICFASFVLDAYLALMHILYSVFWYFISLRQVVPHITDAIQEWIERAAMIPVDGKEGPADVCVIELGGTIGRFSQTPDMTECRWKVSICANVRCFTVWLAKNLFSDAGDIESMPFIEALGQFSYRVGKHKELRCVVQICPLLSCQRNWSCTPIFNMFCILPWMLSTQVRATFVWYMSAWCLFWVLLVSR